MQTTRSSSRRLAGRIVVLMLVGAGILYFTPYWPGKGAAGGPGGPGGFAVPVEAVRIRSEPLEITVDAVGTLMPDESVILRPENARRVEKIHFVEGASAKKGDLLISMDARTELAAVKEAEAGIRLAQLSFNRAKKLAATGAVSVDRLDQATADLGVARAKLDSARTRLDYSRITAPFDGTVGLRHVSPGDYVKEGQDLVNFQNSNPMKIDFSLPEMNAGLLQPGQTLAIQIDALPGESFTGTVYAFDPQLDVDGRSVKVRAMVPNPDLRLRAGYFARVHLLVERKENALMVPEEAIVPQGGEVFVYAINAENKIEPRPIKIGLRRSGAVEILSGIMEGDLVMTAGHLKVRPGAPVQPMVKEVADTPAPAPEAAAEAPASDESSEPGVAESGAPESGAPESGAPESGAVETAPGGTADAVAPVEPAQEPALVPAGGNTEEAPAPAMLQPLPEEPVAAPKAEKAN